MYGLWHTLLPSRLSVNNLIPDWDDLVYKHDWKKALDTLHLTNNFPELQEYMSSPCEASCTLNLTDKPVSIKSIECSIVDYGWKKGWIKPQLPLTHTDKKVAVIGLVRWFSLCSTISSCRTPSCCF